MPLPFIYHARSCHTPRRRIFIRDDSSQVPLRDRSIWIAIGCGPLFAWIMYNFVGAKSLNEVLRRRNIIRIVTIVIAIGTVVAYQVVLPLLGSEGSFDFEH